ncbi:MAG: hypothetical protein WDZ88_00920 [Candidatus Paceibacterota bacterium]
MITIAIYITVTLVALFVTLVVVARNDWQATYVNPGKIKIILKGGNIHDVLVNQEGLRYDKEARQIRSGEPDFKKNLLWRLFGIYWVGFTFPLYRVHKYKFEWDEFTLKQSGEYAVESRAEETKELYWRYTYPVIARDVELEGNITVDIGINIQFEAIDPITAVFVLEGTWLAQATAAIEGALNSFTTTGGKEDGKGITFAELRRIDKSKLVEFIMNLNKEIGNNPGIIEAFGMKIVKVDFKYFQLSGESKTVQEALLAQEIARQQGLARIIAAQKDAEAIVILAEANKTRFSKEGQGRAAGLKSQLNVADKYGSEGIGALNTQNFSEGISGASTIAVGQGGILPTLNVGEDRPKKLKLKDKRKGESE